MSEFDPYVIRAHATGLGRSTSASIVGFTLLGGVVGAIVGAGMDTQPGTWVTAAAIALGAVLGGAAGLRLGWGVARMLHARSQMLLLRLEAFGR